MDVRSRWKRHERWDSVAPTINGSGVSKAVTAAALGWAIACCATAPSSAKGDTAGIPAAAENEVVRYLKGAERVRHHRDE